MQKILWPDAPDASTGSTDNPAPAAKPTKRQLNTDIAMASVCTAVAAKWVSNPNITLIWTSAAEFSSLAASYAGHLDLRRSVGSNRPSQTSNLRQLDNMMNLAVIEVKVYIEKKFTTKNAPPQYARYGISKQGTNRGYYLPADRNERLAALKLMKTAIVEDGFGSEEYGIAFWTGIETAYQTALNSSNATDSMVSNKVSAKNEIKKELQKVLANLRLVIRGNYPDTYLAVYREWGWQKEDY